MTMATALMIDDYHVDRSKTKQDVTLSISVINSHDRDSVVAGLRRAVAHNKPSLLTNVRQ